MITYMLSGLLIIALLLEIEVHDAQEVELPFDTEIGADLQNFPNAPIVYYRKSNKQRPSEKKGKRKQQQEDEDEDEEKIDKTDTIKKIKKVRNRDQTTTTTSKTTTKKSRMKGRLVDKEEDVVAETTTQIPGEEDATNIPVPEQNLTTKCKPKILNFQRIYTFRYKTLDGSKKYFVVKQNFTATQIFVVKFHNHESDGDNVVHYVLRRFYKFPPPSKYKGFKEPKSRIRNVAKYTGNISHPCNFRESKNMSMEKFREKFGNEVVENAVSRDEWIKEYGSESLNHTDFEKEEESQDYRIFAIETNNSSKRNGESENKEPEKETVKPAEEGSFDHIGVTYSIIETGGVEFNDKLDLDLDQTQSKSNKIKKDSAASKEEEQGAPGLGFVNGKKNKEAKEGSEEEEQGAPGLGIVKRKKTKNKEKNEGSEEENEKKESKKTNYKDKLNLN